MLAIGHGASAMIPDMTKRQVIERLRKACDLAGSRTAFAKRVGVPVQFVSNILNGHEDPSPKVLDAIGLVVRTKRMLIKTYAEKSSQDAA